MTEVRRPFRSLLAEAIAEHARHYLWWSLFEIILTTPHIISKTILESEALKTSTLGQLEDLPTLVFFVENSLLYSEDFGFWGTPLMLPNIILG